MKYKKIMLVALVLLAILTIGAVSASDDGGELAAAEIGGGDSDIVESPADDSEIISESGDTEEIGAALDEEVLGDGNFTKVQPDIHVSVDEDDEGVTANIEFDCPAHESDNGEFTVSVDGMSMAVVFVNNSASWYYNLAPGDYELKVNYPGDSEHASAMAQVSFTVSSKDYGGNGTDFNWDITTGNGTDFNWNITPVNGTDDEGDENDDEVSWLWLNTGVDFSTAPEDLPTIFASVTVPEGTEGNVTFRSNDRILYNLALSDFIEGRIDREDNRYNIALEVYGEFIFEGLNDGDGFQFVFLDENGDELRSRDYHIFFGDNTVRFEEDAHNPGDHVSIDVSGEVNINDDWDFVWINLPSDVTEGKVIVVSGNFTLFEESVNFEEGTHWWTEIDEHYVCSFSPNNLTNWDKLNTGDIVTFAFLDGEDQMVESKDYSVTVEDDNVRFEECRYVDVGIWDEDDERGTLYIDSEGYVLSLYVPRSYEGNVFRIYVNGNKAVEWEAEFDGDNEWEYKDWGLGDLEIIESGDYNIAVEVDNGEDSQFILNKTITVSEFKEDEFRAMILYAQEVIKFYTPQDGEGTLTIITEKETENDNVEQIFEESYEITDEYRGNWMEFALEDLEFKADGAFRIFTLTVTNSAGDEVYRYRISHVAGEDEEHGDGYMEKIEFAFNSDEDDEEIIFNKTSDVLVAWLYIPDIVSQSYNPDTGEYEDYYEYEDVSAIVYVSLNGELIKTISTSNFTEPLERPNHYPIILDLSGLKDKDMLTFRVEAIHENTGESAIDEEENEWMVVIEDKGDYVIFHNDVDFKRLEFSVFAGNLTLGTTNDPDLMGVIKHNLVIVTISDALDINEGTITVSDGKSTIFTKQLSECVKEYDYGSAGYEYRISLDDVKDILPEGTNLTVSFNYAGDTLSQKRIRFGDYLYAVVTVEDINKQYRFEIQDDVMLHENDTAIHLVSDTNRQAIYFDLGGGYFTVYVNGVKVKDLGNISYNTWKDNSNWREDDWDFVNLYLPDEEAFLNYVAGYWGSELELFHLTSWTQGAPEIDITLADLGITESGTYNIRITHYPSVPGGLDDHSALGYESMYADEMLIPTVTEVLNTTITCNFDPDYAAAKIYPVTIYGNGIPFLFTFEFGDNILSQDNRALIYVDEELAFDSPILYYDENDEGEMELCKLWIVGPEMLNEALFDEYGLLDVGEYDAVVYLVKGNDAPVEIGRGSFSRIKQRGDMDFTIGSSAEDDGVHTILYADIPEGNWTDYTLEINIADSEGVYPSGDELWNYWFNEYVIFKDDDIYFRDSLEDIIGKGPVAIDLGVLDEGTRIFVALEHGEETVFGDWDFYHNYFTAASQGSEIPNIEDLYELNFRDEININSEYSDVLDYRFDSRVTGTVAILINGTEVYNKTIEGDYYIYVEVGDLEIEGYDYGNYTIDFVYSGDETFEGFTKSQNVELTYTFRAYLYEDSEEYELAYGHSAYFDISMPYDSSANIVYILNGKEYSIPVSELYDGDFVIIDAKDIVFGQNNITFKYVSDNYPLKTFDYQFTPKAVVDMPRYILLGETLYVTVKLPDDANGMLYIYDTIGSYWINGSYLDDTLDFVFLASGKVENGSANISVSDLSLGTHYIYVNYTGDYEIFLPVWDDELGVDVHVVPEIILPERVWVNGNYTGKLILPQNYNGNLCIRIGEEKRSFAVVNGSATFDLFNLDYENNGWDDESIRVYYSYTDEDHECSDFKYITVMFISPQNALELYKSEYTQVLVKGVQSYSAELSLPFSADGNVTIYVDDEYYGVDSGYDMYIRISTGNLTVGKHEVRFEYSGDDYFAPDTAYDTFNVSLIEFEIPEYIIIGEFRGSASTALVLLPKDATGEVKLIVDGTEFATQQVEDGSVMFGLSNLTYGNHTLTLAYQNGNYPSTNKTVNIEAKYGLVIDDLIYGKEDAYVQLPAGATGTVTAEIAGKLFTATVDKDGIARFNITGIIGGEYQATVTYGGDDTYLPGSETFNLTVFYKVCSNIDDEEIFVDNLANYTYELILPENATGRLEVGYNEWNDEEEDDVFTELADKYLENGKAVITLQEVFANHDGKSVDLYARYVGGDYVVEPAWNYVSINGYDIIGPEDYANIALGQTAVYTIKLSGNRTGYFKVLTGRNYKTVLLDNISIVDGEATISIPTSVLGEQSFRFYCPDADLSIYRHITVCPLNATLADEATGDDAVLTVQMPDDASGTLTLYIYAWDDESEELLSFSSAYEGSIAVINASNIPAGHWIESYYLIDDAKYGKSSFREGYDFIIKEAQEEIIPVDANLTVSASDINAGQVAVIDITIASNATGIVTVDGKEVSIVNGAAKYEISDLAAGVYNFTVKFAGDKYFNADEKTVTIKVAKLPSSVAVDVKSAFNVGDEIVISINSTADVTVVINNKAYEVKDGKVVINSSELGAGTFMVVATIAGDDSTVGSSANATFTISKIPTEIIVVNETIVLYTKDYIEDVASLSPADAGDLTFTSSDENVVLAADGVIFANSTGTATVTVSFAGNDRYAAAESKTITVTVRLKDASVSVENDTLDLKVDDRYDLNATISSEALNIQYSSSDESVATVTDYGIVTAVGEGTAIITLTVGNDVTFARNSTEVTVKVSKIPTEITIASPTGEFSVGAMGHVAAELVPSDAGELSYASNDTSVVNVSSTGVIKANGAGTALITVSFAGNDKYAAAESKTMLITVEALDASVNVSKTSYTLNVGDNDTIVAVSVPAGLKVNFETDDDSVVSVDSQGNIVALGIGKTTVFVSVGDNVVYKYDSVAVDVTVTAKDLPKTITKDTFNSYFDKNGVYIADLDEIIFVGEFTGIDTLTFSKPVAIAGQDAVFNNVSFKINADNVSVKGITFNNAAADYVITATGSNGLSLIGNTINAINGILISDVQDFTVDSNAITSTAGVNINGIYITGTASGIVKNNNLDLKSEKTAYAINTNPTGPFKVSYINNTIRAESYFAVGIYDDSEVIKDNNITLVCNYGAGIVVLSDNTTVDSNDVSVNASNEGDEEIPDENVNETSGILVKASAEITNNAVESTAKSISVVEGSSTISDNQLVGSVSVSSDGNSISGNTIVTEEEYAIDLGNSSGNTITDNELYAGESQGSEAINAGNGSNDISGNDIKNSTFDVTGPVEFDYNASGSTEIVNLTGASNVTAFVVDHPEAAVTVDGAKVTVSGLNPGSYKLNITAIPDKGYSASSKLVDVTVNKVKAPVGNDTFNFDENKTVESKTPTYSISLPSDATGNLTVTIGTKTYTKALVNGTATIVADDLPAGDYNVTIAYSGDSKYSPIVKTSKATVKVDPKIVAKDATVQYNAGKYYSVTVYGDDGKLASGVQVTFTLNGKKIATAKTGTNGVAKFKVTQTPVTNAKLVISALGKSVTKKLTVKHLVTLKKVTVKKSAKKLVLQATLAKVNGKYLKNKKITFKFNGKKYTAKTNKKGVAKVTVKSNVLKKLKVGKKVTYQATYVKDTVKKTVKVKK